MTTPVSMPRTTSWYRKIAPVYDWICGPLYRRPRRRAVQMLNLQAGESVLDLGCGTGLSLPALSEAVGEHGQVFALDATDAMLQRAQTRCRRHALHNVQFLAEDLLAAQQALPQVDAILCSYVLAITPQWQAFAAVAKRLLLPGGRMVIVDTKPLDPPWRWLNPLVVPFANWTGAGQITRTTWMLCDADSQHNYLGGFVFVASLSRPS
jgi:ubiquinone/menaquinone biosynthesis C-methylase UbiE